ncbi:MAG: oxidoreductase [Gammaproteobacteria bacterium]|nr:MAG: oxidoreductase [Gammaproteobacteria bacterium]
MLRNITFIGLGVMGFPMAGHLANSDHPVTVYNRTFAKAKRWSQIYSGTACEDAKESVKNADVVVSCLSDDQSLVDMFLGDNGLLPIIPKKATLIDHTTASAEIARTLYAKSKALDIYFIDAPVSGGEQGAINGGLTTMCGGERSAFDNCKEIMACYSQAVTLMGPSGAGQLTKMVNQITLAGLIQGLAEGLHFAENAKLDPTKVIEVIAKGAAQSWQMDNRHKTMIKAEYNHGFAVELMRKDLGICLAEARKNNSTLPVTALVDQFYSDIQALGGNRWDTSSLLERLRKNIHNSS